MANDTVMQLDKFYSSALGCTPDDLNSGRLVVVKCEKITGIRFAKGAPLALFSIGKGTGAVVSVLPDLYEAAANALIGSKTLDENASRALEAALTPVIQPEFWFEGCRLYCDRETFVDQTNGDVRDVTDMDEIAVGIYNKWGGRVFGQILDGRVVSWAGVKPLSGVGWDLTVQTLSEYRGMGHAKSAVSAAVKYILDNGKIATWGADRTNIASLRTAHALGFQDYGLDFGCVCIQCG
ncbi:GNAT family N-acetyltransferase [bacterium]|nr:GNAT family N-acetyltransferase [bacterium]